MQPGVGELDEMGHGMEGKGMGKWQDISWRGGHEVLDAVVAERDERAWFCSCI